MEDKGQRNLHLLMGGLLLASFILDQKMDAIPFWSPPPISMISLVLAMVWLGQFTLQGHKSHADRIKVMQDRLKRAEHKIDGLEQELTEQARRQNPLA